LPQDTTTQCVLFPALFEKLVVARFDQQQGSSDGGGILLQAADRQLGLSATLAVWLRDERQSGKVEHTIHALLGQRIFDLACGYADTNDAARLTHDPVHKLLVGLDPGGEEGLASQPTLCRFENAFGPKDLLRCAEALADTVLSRQQRRLKKRVRRITIDVDATDDPTHGEQQLSFFNGHYHHACYLPLLCFVTFNDEREQFLLTAVLQPGNAAPAGAGLGVICRVIQRVRSYFPQARLRVRLDSAHATPQMLDYLDEANVEYVVSLIANSVLDGKAEAKMKLVRKISAASGQSERLYGECLYRTQKTWKTSRRVIYKAEVVREGERAPRDNQHYLVTNFHQTPQWVYKQFYCQRGDIENRIKELQPRSRNRSHQLPRILGQSTASAAHRRSLRADAGTPYPGHRDRMRPIASAPATRALVENRRFAGGFCSSRGAPLPAILPLLGQLSPYRFRTRSCGRLIRQKHKNIFSFCVVGYACLHSGPGAGIPALSPPK